MLRQYMRATIEQSLGANLNTLYVKTIHVHNYLIDEGDEFKYTIC